MNIVSVRANQKPVDSCPRKNELFPGPSWSQEEMKVGVGYCWVLLGTVGYCWVLLGTVGDLVVWRKLIWTLSLLTSIYTSSFRPRNDKYTPTKHVHFDLSHPVPPKKAWPPPSIVSRTAIIKVWFPHNRSFWRTVWLPHNLVFLRLLRQEKQTGVAAHDSCCRRTTLQIHQMVREECAT